jgi:membrane protease YdiL (CAAX protease family)
MSRGDIPRDEAPDPSAPTAPASPTPPAMKGAAQAAQLRGALRTTDPLPAFFGLTFCISWGFWVPMIVLGREIAALRIAGTFGPLVAAILVAAGAQGLPGVYALWRRFTRWRVGVRWYLFALLSTAVVVLTALGLDRVLAGSTGALLGTPILPQAATVPGGGAAFPGGGGLFTGGGAPLPAAAALVRILLVFGYVLLFSVLGEETGWRGFALPRLQRRIGPLGASVLLGLIWGVWHLPLFLIPGSFHQEIPFALFVVQAVAHAVVMTWLYNHTGGSLVPVHLFHAASNTTVGLLPILPMRTAGNPRPLMIAVALLVALAAGIVASGTTGGERQP